MKPVARVEPFKGMMRVHLWVGDGWLDETNGPRRMNGGYQQEENESVGALPSCKEGVG